MSSTTWHNHLATPIPGDVDPAAVIQILHDHDFILSLNQIVTHHEKIRQEGDKHVYNVTESIPIIPPIWKRSVNFQATFENQKDGVWTWVQAPMGVTMSAKYSVKLVERGEGVGDVGEAGWLLNEEIEASCSVLLKAFVEKTMLNSHRNMQKRFIERAREAKKENVAQDPQQ